MVHWVYKGGDRLIKVIVMMFTLCGDPNHIMISDFTNGAFFHESWDVEREIPYSKTFKDVLPDQIHYEVVEIGQGVCT